MRITGKDLIDMGHAPGPWFGPALEHINANALEGEALEAYVASVEPVMRPKMGPRKAGPLHLNIAAQTEAEAANVAMVTESMRILMQTPTIEAGAVMPDACPAGPKGTIPVGGVVAARNAIHPGMHSADICCSVMISEFPGTDPKALLDAVQAGTHFGPGGRAEDRRLPLPGALKEQFRANGYLRDPKIMAAAESHMGTQGDGNHFAFVGVSRARGVTCLVTHHGSRGPGALLYKKGMQVAERYRQEIAQGVLKQNAWIPADSDDGRAYWQALQIVRAWTKANHEAIHQAAADRAGARIGARHWNEHNFVFREGDLYYHAKGATPVHEGFLPDSDGVQIVPLNMAEPVLLVRGRKQPHSLGFAPHGAGRNFSRSAHKRALAGQSDTQVFAEETRGIDARFWCGRIDTSELPSAYKPAAKVRAQMEAYGLAELVDEIVPYGSIMAGDWEHDAPWRRKARAKVAARAAHERG